MNEEKGRALGLSATLEGARTLCFKLLKEVFQLPTLEVQLFAELHSVLRLEIGARDAMTR